MPCSDDVIACRLHYGIRYFKNTVSLFCSVEWQLCIVYTSSVGRSQSYQKCVWIFSLFHCINQYCSLFVNIHISYLEPRMKKTFCGIRSPETFNSREHNFMTITTIRHIYRKDCAAINTYSLFGTRSFMMNPFASLQRSLNMLSSNATL